MRYAPNEKYSTASLGKFGCASYETKVTDFGGETEKYSLVVSDKYSEYFFFQRKSYCEFWIEMFTSLKMLQSYDSCLFEEMK